MSKVQNKSQNNISENAVLQHLKKRQVDPFPYWKQDKLLKEIYQKEAKTYSYFNSRNYQTPSPTYRKLANDYSSTSISPPKAYKGNSFQRNTSVFFGANSNPRTPMSSVIKRKFSSNDPKYGYSNPITGLSNELLPKVPVSHSTSPDKIINSNMQNLPNLNKSFDSPQRFYKGTGYKKSYIFN